MPLPSWVGDRMKATFKISDSAANAPGYRIFGKDFYTCVQPADRSADKAIVAMIRAFCPDVIPIWRKQQYMAPGSTKLFTVTHLGIARFVKNPRHDARLAYVEMPFRAKHPRPNRLVRIFEDIEHEIVMHHGGPAPYQPLDMTIYRALRADYIKDFVNPTDAFDETTRRNDEAKAKNLEFEMDQYLYMRRDIERFTMKQLNAPGDTVRALKQWRIKKRLQMLAEARRRFPHLFRSV